MSCGGMSQLLWIPSTPECQPLAWEVRRWPSFSWEESLVLLMSWECTMKAQFINTLRMSSAREGAMDKLISNSTRVEISNQDKDVLRAIIIDDWQSKLNYQHQNFGACVEVHQAECQLDHELEEHSRGDLAPMHEVGNQCDESYS
jgi:hypothetical protein